MPSPTDRLVRIVREFPENGMKLLLEHPANVRDLLRLGARDISEQIDFDLMTAARGTLVQGDFRRLESDLLLTAPLQPAATPGSSAGARVKAGGGEDDPTAEIDIYVLIEHQSQSDRLMPFRLLRYVVQIFERQLRQREGAGRLRSRIRFHPVLPVVLHTGRDRWDSPGTMADLVERADLCRAQTPTMEPVFLSLRALSTSRLESEGGQLGHLLQLVKDRKSGAERFRRLLARSLDPIAAMAKSERERPRGLDFLAYLSALVHHSRPNEEITPLEDAIASAAPTPEFQRELETMNKSMTDLWLEQGIEQGIEQGNLQGRRGALVHLLERRFGPLPPPIAARIDATEDPAQIDAWLERVLDASTLDDMGLE